MKKTLYSTFIFLFLITGCQDIKNDLGSLLDEKKDRRIVVLVDFSLSIPEATIDWYKDVISSHVLSSLQIDDRIIVLPVDKAAQTSGIELAVYDLNKDDFIYPQDPPNQKKELAERRVERYLDTLTVNFSNKFDKVRIERKEYALQTDIIGGLSQSLKYFKENTDNYIIILSDMLHDTKELNLEAYLSSKPEPLELIEKIDLIDMKTSKVFVLTGNQPSITINDYKWLKNFWFVFSEKNNANLVSYESGGISLLLDYLK